MMRFLLTHMLVVFTLTAVSCQDQVRGFIGQDVLLPCYTRTNASVFWRDRNDSHILNIKQSKPDTSSQHPNFRGRVESFPDEYVKGNFSILLKNLQQSDTGPYDCLVPKVNFKHRVQLSVTGERAAAVTTLSPGASGHSTAVTLNSLPLILMLLVCVLN